MLLIRLTRGRAAANFSALLLRLFHQPQKNASHEKMDHETRMITNFCNLWLIYRSRSRASGLARVLGQPLRMIFKQYSVFESFEDNAARE